jgi:hypothetical protein
VTSSSRSPLAHGCSWTANARSSAFESSEKAAFESRRDQLPDLCGDAPIDASVDGSLVGDRPQRETFQLPPQLPRSREIAKIPQ